jgi:hypothetical protein
MVEIANALAQNYQYVFPSAYGGFVGSAKPPLIHGLIKELRVEIGAVKAVKQAGGPMFPVRGAKDLAQKLANALNTLTLSAPVVAQEITICDVSNLPKNETRAGGPVFRTLAHVKATVRLTAPDTSFVDLVGSGHGGDVDDKSGGKASTYAWKDALLKGLSIPHEDMVDSDDSSSIDEGSSGGVGAKGVRGAGKGGRNEVKASGEAPPGGPGAGGDRAAVVGAVAETPGVAPGVGRGVGATASEASDLGQTLARIAAANSIADLESIREDIKLGAVKLHGADKLKATQVWVARKVELQA